MGLMFDQCMHLTSLDVSKFDTANVTNMGRMFYRCRGLASLDLSSFDTANVTTTLLMFNGCSGLKQVTLKEGWRFKFAECHLPATMYVKDGNGSFAEYTGGFPTAKTDTYYTEKPTPKAFAVVYDDGNNRKTAKLYKRYIEKMPIEGELFDDGCGDGSKKVFAVYDDIESEKSQSLFYDKPDVTNYLTTVTVVDSIQPSTMQQWFRGCSELSEIKGLSLLNTSNVKNMSSMFRGCGSLTSLDVSKFDTAKVTDMGYMFSNCWRLTSLDVSKFATGNVTNMSGMFGQCGSLTSLNLSKFDTSSVTNMSEMFFACSDLKSLDLSKFDTANVTDMSRMFWGCRGLTSLVLSKFDTSSVTNMGYMFYGCRGLTSLDVSGFDTAKVRNMGYMFEGCSDLKSLDLSKFDTANVTDMSRMFWGCNKLNTVTFPNDAASTTQLKKALSDCGITLRSNQRTIDEDANALSASDNMESHQCEEGVEHRNLQYEGAAPLSGSTAAAAIIAPSSNVSNAGKTEADSPGQSGGSESKEPSAEKADNCQPDSDGNLSSDKSGSSAHMK